MHSTMIPMTTPFFLPNVSARYAATTRQRALNALIRGALQKKMAEKAPI